MRSSLSAATVFLSALQLVSAQTFTQCDPTKKTCPANPGLGGTYESDFTKGKNSAWTYADETTINYDPNLGAVFTITKTEAPTMAFSKYIMFGKVTVTMRAAPGAGIVSSFILESADLDEIDWEWIGAVPNDAQSNFFGKGNTTSYDRGAHHAMSEAVADFHTYEIDWNKDAIKWSIDGSLVRTLPYNSPLALGGQNYPQTPMQVKMGSWVGCASQAAASDPKTEGTCQWASGPADFSKAPFNMYVQKVTIQDYGCGGDYTYSDMSGSYQSIQSSGKCDGNANVVVSSSQPVAAVTGMESGSISQGSSVATSASSTSSPASSSNSITSAAAAQSSSATGGAASSSGSNGTTLASVSSTGNAPPVPSKTGSATSAATKPAHKYGYLDLSVIALGLGLGYFVM